MYIKFLRCMESAFNNGKETFFEQGGGEKNMLQWIADKL